MLLMNDPIPDPLLVLVVRAIVGFWLVLQQIPRAVMVAPPSSVTLPPLLAVVAVIAETGLVVIEAKITDGVTKEIGLP